MVLLLGVVVGFVVVFEFVEDDIVVGVWVWDDLTLDVEFE